MATVPAIVVLLSFSFTGQCFAKDTAAEADPPFNLQVASLNDSSVLVGWDFTTPPAYKIDEIKFLLERWKFDEESSKLTVHGDRRLRAVLSDLDNGTIYTVRITPMLGSKLISKNASKIFKTLDRDWPGVQLKTNDIITRGRKSALHKMTWQPTFPISPQRYVATVCTKECQHHHLTEPVLFYTLKYNETYNVTVTSVYSQPMVNVNRTSLLAEGWSEPGAPTEVRELWKVNQRRDFIHLRWKAPEFPNGPISRYNVTISDAQNRGRKSEFSVNTTELEEQVPIPFGKYYHVKISAVSENESSILVGKEAEFLIESQKTERPSRIKITECRRDFVSFSVIPADVSPWDYFYRVQAKEKNLVIYTHNSTEIKGLKTYETTYLSVCTCFNDTLGDMHCSHPMYTSVTSNVEAPSGVSDLQAHHSKTGKPVISWSTPEHKGGPLEGYILKIFDPANPDSVLLNKTLAPTEHEFEFKEAQEHISYLFVIAAYNVDLNSGEKLIGEELSIELSSGLTSWILVIIVIASLILLCLLAIQILARKRDASESKFCSFVPCSKSKNG